MRDVPPDVLLMVRDWLTAFDLDTFTTICKKWRAAAARRLAEHNRLKREYNNVKLLQNRDHWKLYFTRGFPKTLQNNPELGFYPRYISLDRGMNLDHFL